MNLPISLRGGVERLPDLLESITARINTLWKKEHHIDGTHGAITADSITASGSVTVGAMAVDDLTVADDVAVGGDVVTAGTLTTREYHRINAADGPRLKLHAEAQPFDARQFQVVNFGQELILQAVNDAETINQGSVKMSRTGVFTAVAGLGTTPINAASLAGTLPPASLPANVALKDAANTFTTHNIINGNLQVVTSISERNRAVALGEWIDVAHSNANFTTNAGAIWTTAGSLFWNRYTLIGKTMIWSLYYQNTTLTAGTATFLHCTIPGGFVAVAGGAATNQLYCNPTGNIAGNVRAVSGQPYVTVGRFDDGLIAAGPVYLQFTVTLSLA